MVMEMVIANPVLEVYLETLKSYQNYNTDLIRVCFKH